MHAANLAGHTGDRCCEEKDMIALVLPAALLVTALALGGVPGFLLGFTAVALAIDRMLGFDDAEHAFRKVARRRGPRLAYLADDVGWAAIAARRRLGVQSIAVASIVGTTDPQKAVAFDVAFRPPEWSRERWMQLWRSARRGAAVPPIAVYRVGDRHFVRDGHHRVSVARALGTECLDAQVVELQAQPSERIISVAHSTAS
jgi:hypothetical protein